MVEFALWTHHLQLLVKAVRPDEFLAIVFELQGLHLDGVEHAFSAEIVAPKLGKHQSLFVVHKASRIFVQTGRSADEHLHAFVDALILTVICLVKVSVNLGDSEMECFVKARKFEGVFGWDYLKAPHLFDLES